MSFSVSELLTYFGSFLGIILSIVIFTTSKGKTAIRYTLACMLIILSLIISLGSLNYSGKAINFIHLIRLDSPLHYLFGPAVYFYTLSSFNPGFRYRKIHLLHLLPFFLNFLEFSPLYFSSAEYKSTYYENLIKAGSVIQPMHYLLKTLSFSAYFVAELLLFKKFNASQKNKSNYYLKSWFFIYLGVQIIMVSGILSDHFTGLKLFDDPYRFAINMVTFCLYSIALALLFYPRLLYGTASLEKVKPEKYSSSKLSNEVKNTFLSQLNRYMQSDEKPYLNEKLSLADVSIRLDISAQQVSQVINEKTGLNFNDYINTFRIEEAKELLISPTYFNLTIDAIAEKAGFRSKSTFYTAFKKHEGCTPKEFIKSKHLQRA